MKATARLCPCGRPALSRPTAGRLCYLRNHENCERCHRDLTNRERGGGLAPVRCYPPSRRTRHRR